MLMKWTDIEPGDKVAIIKDLDHQQAACMECLRLRCDKVYKVESIYVGSDYIELTLHFSGAERRTYVELDLDGRLFCSGCGDVPEGRQSILKVVSVKKD